MFKSKKYILFLVAGFLSLSTAIAQNSASAYSTVIILEPASIVKVADMNFGYILPGTTAGTVILDPATSTRSKTGGVNFSATAGPVSPATFQITSNNKYKITLPTGSFTLTRLDGTETMTINTFTKSPNMSNYPTTVTTIYVGATLNVGANQVNGEYRTNSTFTVTVNLP